jgi:ABC-type amino acid transport substrate-binding protein
MEGDTTMVGIIETGITIMADAASTTVTTIIGDTDTITEDAIARLLDGMDTIPAEVNTIDIAIQAIEADTVEAVHTVEVITDPMVVQVIEEGDAVTDTAPA